MVKNRVKRKGKKNRHTAAVMINAREESFAQNRNRRHHRLHLVARQILLRASLVGKKNRFKNS
jgi:hypothetical protein